MGLLEIFFERSNPGPVGTVDGGGPPPMVARSWVIYARGLAGLAIILVGSDIVLKSHDVWSASAVFAFYLLLSFWFVPKPDYSNVGMAGGLIDHPLRWSDHMNRMLALLAAITWPGRFAVSGLRDAINLARGKRVIHVTRSTD